MNQGRLRAMWLSGIPGQAVAIMSSGSRTILARGSVSNRYLAIDVWGDR